MNYHILRHCASELLRLFICQTSFWIQYRNRVQGIDAQKGGNEKLRCPPLLILSYGR